MPTSISKWGERVFTRYSAVVIGHPILVIIFTVLLSSCLSIFSLYFCYSVVDFDPTKGFETRGTPLSVARLTLEAMKPHQVGNERILRWHFEQDTSRKKREIQNNLTTSTLEPITVDYDDYGVDSEPNSSDLEDHCEMFAAIGKSIPYDIIEYLGKIMIRVSSYDDLFTVDVMKHLCHVDTIIDELITEYNFTNSAKALKHSLNIPLYTTCQNISTENSCNAINEKDILNFRRLLFQCKNNSSLNICSAFSLNQVNNWLLPIEKHNELVITVILRITMWNGVDNREMYDALINQLYSHFEKNRHLRLAGVSLNLKNRVFQDRIQSDSLIAGASALLVFICFLTYSRSLLFTGVILMVVALSSGVAFFIYTVVLGIDFFPFINLMVVVILISIGADDAFLLLVYFRKEVEKMSTLEYKVGSIYVPLYRESDLHSRSLRLSLHHSLASMFVTSLTTAATFLTNLTSPIIVLRCFGIYAAITVLVNYILVVLILPGAIILTSSTGKGGVSSSDTPKESPKRFSEKLTEDTFNFRFAIVLLSLILSGLSIFIIFFDPGLAVPRTNPMKLLVDSNVHEYFDNHVHHFNFQWQRSARLVKNFIFGVQPINEPSGLSPYNRPYLNFSGSHYEFTHEKLDLYRRIVDSEFEKYKISNYSHTSWADRMLQANESCISEGKVISNSCILHGSVRNKNLIHQFPDDFAVIPGDGPFVDQDLNVVGYFISIPSNEKLRIDADATALLFKEIEVSCERINNQTEDKVLCLSSTEISRFYDIVAQLRSSSYVSVIISIVICLLVIILCTRVIKLSLFSSIVIIFVILWTIASLILLGWKLSVVESTILIITIGLSFDYTLHYVVAITDTKHVSTVQKVCSAHSTAGVACSFGAVTLLLAGVPLLFAHTASFYQVGSMLVVLGATSLFGAAIVFPAFVLTFSCDGKDNMESTKL